MFIFFKKLQLGIRGVILPLSMIFLFVSCEDILSDLLDEAVDCVFKISPELKGDLGPGKVGSPYSGLITASVKNSPREDSFNYIFDVYGELPMGVGYSIINRSVRLSGKPTEPGVFIFYVNVEIEDTLDLEDDRLCFGQNNVTKKFIIEVKI